MLSLSMAPDTPPLSSIAFEIFRKSQLGSNDLKIFVHLANAILYKVLRLTQNKNKSFTLTNTLIASG